MPKSDNQKAKLFALYQILHDYTDEDNGLSMAEIIVRLESNYNIVAERRSITSDFATLETVFHIEIEARKSETTRYYLRTRTFSFSDIKALERGIQTNDTLSESAARELVKKLKSLCSIHEGKRIYANLPDHIRGIDEDMINKIETLESAIKDNKTVRFSYPRYAFSAAAHVEYSDTQHNVSPFEIVYVDGQYYLFARKHSSGYYYSADCKKEREAIYYFALEKMKGITTSRGNREGIEQFEKMAAVDYEMAAAYPVYGGKSETISIKFTNDLLGLLKERFGADIEISNIDDKYSRVAAAAEITPEFFGWLFSFGTGARLLTPLHAVQRYKKWIKDVYEMYQVPAKLSKEI